MIKYTTNTVNTLHIVHTVNVVHTVYTAKPTHAILQARTLGIHAVGGTGKSLQV